MRIIDDLIDVFYAIFMTLLTTVLMAIGIAGLIWFFWGALC